MWNNSYIILYLINRNRGVHITAAHRKTNHLYSTKMSLAVCIALSVLFLDGVTTAVIPTDPKATNEVDFNATDDLDLNATDYVDLNAIDEADLNVTDDVDLNATEEADLNATDDVDLNATDNLDVNVTDYLDLNAIDEADLNATDEVDLNITDDVDLNATDDVDSNATDETDLNTIDRVDLNVPDDVDLNATEEVDLNATDEVHEEGQELSEAVDDTSRPTTAFDNEIQSYLYKTAKNYYCTVKYFENPEVLLYANKTWTFPKQDVNLTLKFPGPNDDYFENFLITGFRVTLYQDGQDSRGFVNSGGMMQNHISISFICSDISVLGYQFWVFGVNKSEANGILYSYEELC